MDTMKITTDTTSTSRRKFLQHAIATGGVAAVAAAAPTVAAAEVKAAGATKTGEEGYRLTQHILDYYKSASV